MIIQSVCAYWRSLTLAQRSTLAPCSSSTLAMAAKPNVHASIRGVPSVWVKVLLCCNYIYSTCTSCNILTTWIVAINILAPQSLGHGPQFCVHAQGIKQSVCLSIVGMKITRSQDLGIWTTRKHNESIKVIEKLLHYACLIGYTALVVQDADAGQCTGYVLYRALVLFVSSFCLGGHPL